MKKKIYLELYLSQRAYHVRYIKLYLIILNKFKQTPFIKQCIQNIAAYYSRVENMTRTDRKI